LNGRDYLSLARLVIWFPGGREWKVATDGVVGQADRCPLRPIRGKAPRCSTTAVEPRKCVKHLELSMFLELAANAVFIITSGSCIGRIIPHPKRRRFIMATLRNAAQKISQKLPNDVVILSAVRSPVTRAFKGGFRNAWPEDILGPVSTYLSSQPRFRKLTTFIPCRQCKRQFSAQI
jgi:hypothetical protein